MGGIVGGGKGPKETTQTTVLDPQTRRYVEWMRQQQQNQYQNLMNGGDLFAGPNAAQTGALGNMSGLQGQLSNYFDMAAKAAGQGTQYGGNPLAMQQAWMNPYQQQVIDAMQPMFDRQMSSATLRANDLATKSGAFGGSRHAVLEAEMRRGLAQDQNQQVANLLQQGFGQSSGLAMQQYGMEAQRAQQMANLGFGAMGQGIGLGGSLAGQQFGMGGSLRDIQNQIMQQELYRAQAGLGMIQNTGPYGQTSTQQQPGGSFLGGMLGGGLISNALFGGKNEDGSMQFNPLKFGLGALSGGLLGFL